MAYYIYNGIKLPALPSGLNEFNYILRSGDFYYLASATAEEKTINADGTIRVSSSEGIFYTFSDGAWVENSNDNAIGYVVWSNTDVYDSTGTLYLAATDPVPVGTPITDPLSFAMGWQLGQRLRMRGKKQWETLFEGEVTLDSASNNGYGKMLSGFGTIDTDNSPTFRVTVSNEQSIGTVGANSGVGNRYIYNAENEDTGENFYFFANSLKIPYLLTRSAGTYSVKVEKAVI